MKNQHPVLTDDQTLEEVISCLTENIPLNTQGDCDRRTIFEILVRAAGARDSIENTCGTLQNAPSADNIRYHLEKFDDMNELETQINHTIQSRLPPRIANGKQRIAIDLNLIPYYGVPNSEEEPYIVRSQAKAGTCSFYTYAAAYVIRKGKRVTVAITSVRRDDTDVAIVTRLLDKMSDPNIRIKRLYLDRGFFSVPVIRWLQTLDIPFEMPVVVRGKKGGTRRLLTGGKSYNTNYTMTSQKYGSVTFEVRVVCVYSRGRYGRNGIAYFAYAVYKIPLSLRAIHKDYRKRFGIETSYRLKNRCRVKTATKNPVVRFLFMGIAYIIKDIWIYLIWKHVSYPRKGGRLLLQERFPLELMLTFLREAVERKYTVINCIYL